MIAHTGHDRLRKVRLGIWGGWGDDWLRRKRSLLGGNGRRIGGNRRTTGLSRNLGRAGIDHIGGRVAGRCRIPGGSARRRATSQGKDLVDLGLARHGRVCVARSRRRQRRRVDLRKMRRWGKNGRLSDPCLVGQVAKGGCHARHRVGRVVRRENVGGSHAQKQNAGRRSQQYAATTPGTLHLRGGQPLRRGCCGRIHHITSLTLRMPSLAVQNVVGQRHMDGAGDVAVGIGLDVGVHGCLA